MKDSQETILVESGEKIEIFKHRFSSLPMTYEFFAKAVGSKPMSGLIEIHRKQIVFSSPIKIINLKPTNAVSVSIWDTFLTIYVIAGCDIEIRVFKRGVKSLKRLFLLSTVLVVIATAIMLLSLAKNSG